MIGFPELFLIVLAIVLLFGSKKIPELMSGVGKGMKSFKDSLNGVDDQINLSQDNKKTDGDSRTQD